MAAAGNGLAARAERAFELTSVVPLAAFVVLHVLDYGRLLAGASEIGARRHPSAALIAAEALLVWLPLFGHALGSFWVYRRRRVTEANTPSLVAHRVAGLVAVVFLVDHFVRFRLPILSGTAHPGDSVQKLAAELSATRGGVPWVAALHLLGIVAVAFHLATGLRRIAERSPRLRGSPVVRRLAVGLAVVAGAVGVLTILKLATGA